MSGAENNVRRFNPFRLSKRNKDDCITVNSVCLDAIIHFFGEQEITRLCRIEDVSPHQRKITFNNGLFKRQSVAGLKANIEGIIQDVVEVPECREQEAEEVAKNLSAESNDVYVSYIKENFSMAIFSKEWDRVDKVKKKLQAKFKRTSSQPRTRNRFKDDQANPEQENVAELVSNDENAECREMDSFAVQGNLLTIKAYKSCSGNLFVDAIVNATPERLMHGAESPGSVGDSKPMDRVRAKLKAVFTRESQIHAADLTVTSGNYHNCRLVFNLDGLRSSPNLNTSTYLDNLRCAILKCLCEARNRGLFSLAIPLLSSALVVSSPEHCIKVYLRALKSFDQTVEGGSLREVHLVDANDSMVSLYRREIDAYWSQACQMTDLKKDKDIVSSFLKPTTDD